MGEYCSWVNYKDQKILVANFSGIQDLSKYLGAIEEIEKELLSQPKGSVMPLLLDMSNSRLFKEVSDRGRQMIDTIKKAGYPDSPTAIVGASSFQKAVISAIAVFRHDIRVFDDQQSAKEWLEKQIKKS